jgi:hypothetical protein
VGFVPNHRKTIRYTQRNPFQVPSDVTLDLNFSRTSYQINSFADLHLMRWNYEYNLSFFIAKSLTWKSVSALRYLLFSLIVLKRTCNDCSTDLYRYFIRFNRQVILHADQRSELGIVVKDVESLVVILDMSVLSRYWNVGDANFTLVTTTLHNM